MSRGENSGPARKRAMILRESQNRPFSNVGSDRQGNEFSEVEKSRRKRECHRPIKAALSPEIPPMLKNSVTFRVGQSATFSDVAGGSDGPRSTDSERERGFSHRRGRQTAEVESTRESASSCEDVFHFTRQITPSVFMNQKLKLELVEKALAVSQEEEVRLQKQLQAALQTAFKLQEVIMKQKMVIELEQVAAQKRMDETEKIWMERDELKRKLDEAIRAKEEAELTLTLSRDLNVRLFPGTKEFADTFQDGDGRVDTSLRTGTSDDGRLSVDEQMELLRQKLDESSMEAVVLQTVAECVYAASFRECEERRIEAMQSTKSQTEVLKRKLDEAVRWKEEAALTVTLSRDLTTRLFPGTGKRCKTEDRFVVLDASVIPAEMIDDSEARDKQIMTLRQELDQTRVEAAVYQAVIESVYAGALQTSEATRVDERQLKDTLAKQVQDLEHQVFSLQEKLNSCDDTVELPHYRAIPALPQFDQDPLIPGESLTPLKLKSDETPIKFFRSKRVTSKGPESGSPWIPRSTTLDLSLAAKREAALSASLRKSVQEMELLGDKVEEHKSILEKVTLLLSYISKSGYSATGSKKLAREICDQLELYDGEFK